MQQVFFICIIALLSVSTVRAAEYLQTIPGPDDTGGMVMPLVSLNFETKTVSVNTTQGDTVTMYPLQQYEVWGQQPYAQSVFSPALADQPWYDLLDPTRQHMPFSTRFGFELASANAHLIPAGAYVYIKATAITEGLKIYDVGYWSDIWQQAGEPLTWSQVFGEGNFGGTLSPDLDNVAAWGDAASIKMWHPIALASDPGLYSARFEIYVGDGYATPLQGWSSSTIELNWVVAVPEPAAAALALGAATCILAARWRRRKG